MDIHGAMILIGLSSMQTLCVAGRGWGCVGGRERARNHVTEEAVGSKDQDRKGIHHM